MEDVEKRLKDFIAQYMKLSEEGRKKIDRDLKQMIDKMREPLKSLFGAVMEFIKAGASSDEISKKLKGGS